MDRHDTFKQTSENQFQSIYSGDNLNQALAERRGCDASKILNEMPSNGARLDAIRDYQRETKNDSQHFPKIDVNFDKDGYEIKAQPNKDINDVKGDKSQSIAKAGFDINDNQTDGSCKNMPIKDNPIVGGSHSMTDSTSQPSLDWRFDNNKGAAWDIREHYLKANPPAQQLFGKDQ
jgi:hypothetical protein